jgi:hypothetical protein
MASRQRAVNYTDDERDLLTNCVSAEMTIINSRVTDGISNGRKRAAWVRITADFNSRSQGTTVSNYIIYSRLGYILIEGYVTVNLFCCGCQSVIIESP